jgi:hypothetical protein
LLVRGALRAFGAGLVIAAVVADYRYLGGGTVLIRRICRTGVNLEAVRGGAEPVWLVAHIDSKWQPVSMITRVVGVLVSAVGLLSLMVLAAFRAADAVAFAVFVVTCAGAIPLMLSYVGDRNHGTLDNASGVAAVLEAAALIAPGASVGVLITDAEELGLAGARAWARSRAPGIALNCDSIDDEGVLTVMYSSHVPSRMVEAIKRTLAERAAAGLCLIPGILTDHVALAAAGWATVTQPWLSASLRGFTPHATRSRRCAEPVAGAARVIATTAGLC